MRSMPIWSTSSLFPILGERIDQRAAPLSGGEQQMLAIGRALMAQAAACCCWTSRRSAWRRLIVQPHFRRHPQLKETGVTILLVEQNARKALEVADRAYVLETGSISLSRSGGAMIWRAIRRVRAYGVSIGSGGARMSGTEFGQQFVNALSLGSIYALVAIGLAMVFCILRLINFAHGEMLMLGAFFTYYCERAGFPFLPVAVLGVGGTVIAGLVDGANRLPADCAARPRCSLLLTSLGVSIAVQNSALDASSASNRKTFPTPAQFRGARVDLAARSRSASTNMVTIVIAIILIALLTYFVTQDAARHSRCGRPPRTRSRRD